MVTGKMKSTSTALNVKLDLSQVEWNEYLAKCVNANIFSTWEWGQYKGGGWSIERLAFFRGEAFVGMIQILIKKLGPFRLGWSSSGINLIDYKDMSDLVQALGNQFDFKRTILRICFQDDGSGENRFTFDSISEFRKPIVEVNSGYTIRFDLKNYSNLPEIYSSNTRYYLKKSLKNDLQFQVSEFNPLEFTKIHNEMVSLKELKHLLINESDMVNLSQHFRDKIFLAKVLHGDEIQSVCAIIKWEKIAYYFLAGANEAGRKSSASFFMINKLIDYLKGEGIKKFDFGGITPFKESAFGVNRFKMGFNGQVVRYIGERELTKNFILYLGFNLLLRFKKGM